MPVRSLIIVNRGGEGRHPSSLEISDNATNLKWEHNDAENGDVRCVSHGACDFVFYASPWFVTHDLAYFEKMREQKQQELVAIPYWGMRNGQWHDGPIVQLSTDGELVNFIPKGSRVQLRTRIGARPSAQGSDDAFAQEEHSWQMILSLVQSLYYRCGENEGALLGLELRSFDLAEMVALSILRKAYPEAGFDLRSAKDYKTWPAVWKRFCQNLGISLYERESRGEDFVLPLDEFAREISAYALILARAVNRFSDVIPRRLLSVDAKI